MEAIITAIIGVIFGIFITVIVNISIKGYKLLDKEEIVKQNSQRIIYKNDRLLNKEGIKLS